MQNRVRTHVAALMLLVPAATAFVAAPAAAQSRFARAPQIESFEVRGGGERFEPGRELRFRLEGTPNARAWVEIPNVTQLELRETRRGVYEGEYVIRRRDDRRDFERAVASLQDNGQRVTARVALRDRDDDRPGRGNGGPQIVEVTPANGARVDDDGRVRIAAKLRDNRRIEDVTLRVDGRDVTGDARIERDEIEYRANLPRGRHTAELSVRDRAGRTARQSWSFDVVERGRASPPVGAVPVPVPVLPPVAVAPTAPAIEVMSHPVDAVWDIHNPHPIRGRTFPHATVRVLVDAVSEINGGGTQQTIADTTVRADANGNFAVVPRLLNPNLRMTGTGYQMRLISTTGAQTAETRLRLRHG